MTTEQLLLILIAAAGAIWTVVKVLIPRVVDARLRGSRDEQEHRQKLEEAQQQYGIIQNSWSADKIATLLEENESFIRERVFDMLSKIESDVKRLEMTQAQTRDTLAILCAEVATMRPAVAAPREEDKSEVD